MKKNQHPKISVVIPILNEEKTLPELYKRLTEVLSKYQNPHEIIFVDDDSRDKSFDIMMGFNKEDSRVKIIQFSRNFGHQAALSAGIDHCNGEAIILMDGDLQDPPELIPEFIAKWQEGYDVVYGVKRKRKEGFLKNFAFKMFYKILNYLSPLKMPPNVGIFSLMDRKAVNVLKTMPERNRYISGLRAWAGFKQTGVEFERERRYEGKPKQTFIKLLKLSMDAIFSFSYLPLRIGIYVGLFSSGISIIIFLWVLYARLFTDKAIIGWASIMVVTTFLGGTILMILGIIGEYLGRIYDEVKARPYYVINKKIGFE